MGLWVKQILCPRMLRASRNTSKYQQTCYPIILWTLWSSGCFAASNWCERQCENRSRFLGFHHCEAAEGNKFRTSETILKKLWRRKEEPPKGNMLTDGTLTGTILCCPVLISIWSKWVLERKCEIVLVARIKNKHKRNSTHQICISDKGGSKTVKKTIS